MALVELLHEASMARCSHPLQMDLHLLEFNIIRASGKHENSYRTELQAE